MTIFEGTAMPNAKEFIKSYFTKDLNCFREQDIKQRMILVRKAVAVLERDHFKSSIIRQ